MFDRVLNMSRLNMSGLLRVLYIPEYTWMISEHAWIWLNMPKYVWMCPNLPEWLLIYFPIVIPCLLECMVTYFIHFFSLIFYLFSQKSNKCLHVNMFQSSPSEVLSQNRCSEECAKNQQENTHTEVWFQWNCLTASLKSHSQTREWFIVYAKLELIV